MSDNKSKNESNPKVRVRTGVKAGEPGAKFNHGLRVRTNVKAGGTKLNHGLRVRTNVKAGNGPVLQHGVRIRQASR
jgi:hypothetical protein